MKFTTSLAIATVVLCANSAALSGAGPWCKYVGQPCPKKRSAEADADAWKPFCGNPMMIGRPCPKVKRDAEAEAVCGADGMPCSKVRRAAEAFAAALAAPAAEADAEAWKPFCGNSMMIGRPCPKMSKREAACYAAGAPCNLAKREAYALAAATADALPAAEAEAFYANAELALREAFLDLEEYADEDISEYGKREAEAWKPFCGNPMMIGRPCPKVKREAEAEADAEAWKPFCGNPMMIGRPCPKTKRDPVAEAICGAEGMPCNMVKRAAEAVAEALASPEAEAWKPFCGNPMMIGRPCPKKREALPEAAANCFAEGGACDIAKRSAEVLFEVAAEYARKI